MKLFDLVSQAGLAMTPELQKELQANPQEIQSVQRDSRRVEANDLFVCITGTSFDGHNYAKQVYDKGCRCFVAEKPLLLPDDAIVIPVDSTRKALALLSDAFFGHPSRSLSVIGITGTKGKTTTALLAFEALNAAGIPTGYIGSNGVRFGSFFYPTANTTPESCELQYYMHRMVKNGIHVLVLEVSSQALYQERVQGIVFDTCVYTNLYRDHIGGSEHPTMEHYKACKRRLFYDYAPKAIIYNADDKEADFMLEGCTEARYACSCTPGKAAFLSAKNIERITTDGVYGIGFQVVMQNGRAWPATLRLPGTFSAMNALEALSICLRVGLSLPEAIHHMADVSIKGRFEYVPSPWKDITFLIDYSHNGTSLEATLKTLRAYAPRRLICLFGSVGGRTFERRRELGNVASALADLCIITSDNPDLEPPEQIIDSIASSFSTESCPYIRIADRGEAIRYVVNIAKSGDLILLAGKGHETYQLIGGQKLLFSERAILRQAIEERTGAPAPV